MSDRATITVNTEQEMAKDVAERWKHQYHDRANGWGTTISGPAEVTHQKILAAKADPRAIKRLGLKGWVWAWCDSCHDYRNPTVTVASYGGDKSETYCGSCVKRMANALANAR